MIHLLINAVAEQNVLVATRFGGLPVAPRGADFQWPQCSTCHGYMQFLGKLLVPGEAGQAQHLIELFMCQNDPGGCDDWDANGGGNQAIVVGCDDCVEISAPASGDAVRDVLHGALLHVARGNDYDEAREQWSATHGKSPREVLGQLGGQPVWIQNDETPTCDTCGQPMHFIAQLEEGPDWKTAMNFGGGGCAYIFACTCKGMSAKFLWQC